LELQEVAVLGVVVDDADDAEIELLVGLDDALAREAGSFVSGTQVRAASVVAPVLVEKLAELQGVFSELELGHVLSHGG
jgi:hypothetical protein